jgi:hypothetical protein
MHYLSISMFSRYPFDAATEHAVSWQFGVLSNGDKSATAATTAATAAIFTCLTKYGATCLRTLNHPQVKVT